MDRETPKAEMRYSCAECGQPVFVKPLEFPRRTCRHDGAGIVAHCSAVLTGEAHTDAPQAQTR